MLVVGVMVKILQYNAALPAGEVRLPAPLSLVLNYAALDFNFTSWMTPDNLRVLRTEQSTGDLPGMRELALQKNHLQHVSPLSMVGDHRARTKRLKRHKSWKDALQDLVGRSEDLPSKRHHHMDMKRKSSVKSFEVPHDENESWADSESEEGESKPVREEDRSIEERVRYVYQDASDTDELHRVLEKQQEKLSAAVTQANLKATTLVAGSHNGKGIGNNREPIGTRLTMTSRTGYFQDRIISPSMVSRRMHRIRISRAHSTVQMRAMAILYIGPHRNPDFATDYLISPILTPPPLLAQFPPLLMQCGEKDPFVDDTVIFAGRVREAKRARKAELDLVLTGKSAKFGEGLRMTDAQLDDFPDEVARMVAERDQLARETEDDWVQMVLFSDWSHGYLQMMTLMSEAKAVVEDLADWIEDAFVRHSGKEERMSKVLEAVDGRGTKKRERRNSPQTSRSPTKRPILHTPSTENGGADGNWKVDASPFTSSTETETDDSGITFIARKRGGSGTPVIQSRRSSDERRDVTEMKQGYSSPSLLSHDVAAAQRDRESATSTPRSNGKTGQRITETELMRRRRLLDAHIFDGPGSS